MDPEPSPESFQYGGFAFLWGGLGLCGGLDILKINKNWFVVFHASIWGDWSFVWEGLAPKSPPLATGLHGPTEGTN